MITKDQREKLSRLERRREYLRQHTYNADATKWTGLSHEQAELSALEWGIEIIEVHLRVRDKTETSCNHTFNLRNNQEVFCIKCLSVKSFIDITPAVSVGGSFVNTGEVNIYQPEEKNEN